MSTSAGVKPGACYRLGLILNWFRAGGMLSSGTVEGFNNQVKLVTRKSYGFKTPKEPSDKPMNFLRIPLACPAVLSVSDYRPSLAWTKKKVRKVSWMGRR